MQSLKRETIFKKSTKLTTEENILSHTLGITGDITNRKLGTQLISLSRKNLNIKYQPIKQSVNPEIEYQIQLDNIRKLIYYAVFKPKDLREFNQ